MRQETAVQDGRGRAGRAGRAGPPWAQRAPAAERAGLAVPIREESYFDRGTPKLFDKWWNGLVSMGSALGRDGLK